MTSPAPRPPSAIASSFAISEHGRELIVVRCNSGRVCCHDNCTDIALFCGLAAGEAEGKALSSADTPYGFPSVRARLYTILGAVLQGRTGYVTPPDAGDDTARSDRNTQLRFFPLRRRPESGRSAVVQQGACTAYPLFALAIETCLWPQCNEASAIGVNGSCIFMCE